MFYLINLSKFVLDKTYHKLNYSRIKIILGSKTRIYSPENVAFLNYVLVLHFKNSSKWPY